MNTIWRFIDSGPCNASFNMALDESLAVSVRGRESPPVLRIYSWGKPSVSIGCFQKSEDIDFVFCEKQGIPVVRRPTGGRALLHYNDITYSFSSRTTDGIFKSELLESYRKISCAFEIAFKKAGIFAEIKLLKDKKRSFKKTNNPLCFESISYAELSVNNKKIIGSAQKRWNDCLLQQGSIPITTNCILIQKIFSLNKAQYSIENFTTLKYLMPEIKIEEFKEIIKISFEQIFDIKFIDCQPTKKEILFAKEIENTKYLSDKWTRKR